MQSIPVYLLAALASMCLFGCSGRPAAPEALPPPLAVSDVEEGTGVTVNTKIADVMADPVFGDYGRLLFPVQSSYYSGETLGELHLTWYTHIDPDKTVEIINSLQDRAAAGETVFYDIYTDAEKAADPAKADTGLFFFKGGEGAPFAICSAGGGFAYVGAMHDSFPHALELSKKGYNAFALIYRPGAQTACEALARAGVEALAGFIKELGLPSTLRELGVTEDTPLEEIANTVPLTPGGYGKLTHKDVLNIFKECF